MSSLDTETLSSLFLLPDPIAIEAVYPTKKRLTLQISFMYAPERFLSTLPAILRTDSRQVWANRG